MIGYKASGTHVPDGTVIFFTCDIGSIEPQAQTEKGIAFAVFRSNDNRSGVANITVHSGNAEVSPESVTIAIGSSALHTLSLSADPQHLPVSGGNSAIKIMAYDENLNTLANIPIILSADAGQLNRGGNIIYTDINGEARDTLQTTTTANVTASSGAITASVTITVENNEKPAASFIYSPTNPTTADNVYFNASDSTDADGNIVSYEWSFGDGAKSFGKNVSHKYDDAGIFTVLLIVTDNNGNTGSANKNITISGNQNPTASFVYSPTNPQPRENVYFNASGSSDPDGTIVNFQWDMGDGSIRSGEKITHRYAESGDYTVLLTITDNNGNKGNTDKTVTVADNQAPTASFVFSPLAPKAGENVYFNGAASSDPDGTITSFHWDFGDGGTANGESVSHIYLAPGTYTVVLVVFDDSGNQSNSSKGITIGI